MSAANSCRALSGLLTCVLALVFIAPANAATKSRPSVVDHLIQEALHREIYGLDAERVQAAMATPGYFDVFGVVPIIGRAFTQQDIDTGNQLVTVVTHGFWTRRFGADSGVVGQPVTLNGLQQHLLRR